MPIRVSIVEDLAEIREGLVDLVRSDRELLMIGSFEDAESAVQKLPDLQADIVVMDINLPGMSGIDCIRNIKEKCPGTQFMMFTVYENDDKVLQAMQAGATGKEIAERLYIGHGTVRQHLHNIYEKLQVHNRTEAVNKYFDRS